MGKTTRRWGWVVDNQCGFARPFYCVGMVGSALPPNFPQALTLRIPRSYIRVMRSEPPALLPIFRSQHQAELLTWLMLHPNQEYSVTNLAKQLKVPLSTLHGEVVRLVESGLIDSRTLGRNRMLRANMAHPASDPLRRLLEVSFGPSVVIGEEFGSVGADEVMIFGSWAARNSGEAGPPPNDVDVLVVGGVERAAAYRAADAAGVRLGLEVNVVLRTEEQWADASDPLTAQIRERPYLVAWRTTPCAKP